MRYKRDSRLARDGKTDGQTIKDLQKSFSNRTLVSPTFAKSNKNEISTRRLSEEIKGGIFCFNHFSNWIINVNDGLN